MWTAIGEVKPDAAIAKLSDGQARSPEPSATKPSKTHYLQWDRVGRTRSSTACPMRFDSPFMKRWQRVVEAPAKRLGTPSWSSPADPSLREIAQMIIKQAILNALRAAFGGTPFRIADRHWCSSHGRPDRLQASWLRQPHTAGQAPACSRRFKLQRYRPRAVWSASHPSEVPIIAKKGRRDA